MKGNRFRSVKIKKELIILTSCQLNAVLSFRWQLIDVVTEKLTDFPEEQEAWRKSLTAAAVKCLTAAFSHYKNQSPPEQEKSILTRLQQLLVRSASSKIVQDLCLIGTVSNASPPYADVT